MTKPFGDAHTRPLAVLEDGQEDGYFVNGRCMGTYLHGILDNAAFIDFLLAPFAHKVGQASAPFDYAQFKEEQYDRLAQHIRQHVDINKIYKILKDND